MGRNFFLKRKSFLPTPLFKKNERIEGNIFVGKNFFLKEKVFPRAPFQKERTHRILFYGEKLFLEKKKPSPRTPFQKERTQNKNSPSLKNNRDGFVL